MIKIMKYENRKLYNTKKHCYMKLEDVFKLVNDGDDIQVIDNKTGADITYKTLLAVAFQRQNKIRNNTSINALLIAMRTGDGTLTSCIIRNSLTNLEEIVE